MKVDKSFYKNFFSLYFILVLQNVVTLSVNLADNIMLGAYSETALSGVAAVNQIQFVYQQVLMALGDGMVIFCSQYWGQKRIEPMKKIAAIAMRTGILVAALLFVMVSIFPHQAVRLFTPDQAIIEAGVSYVKIIRFTYIFFAVTQILLATLRSTEVVKIAFKLSIMAFFVNCGINYALIYGKFGMPEMGIAGAAVGTLVARVAEFAVLLGYIIKKEQNLKLRLSDYFVTDKELRRDYFKVTAPMLVIQTLWGLNNAVQTRILGYMTATAIAANSAASNLYLMVKSMAVGAASTASIIIGKTIGTGDVKRTQCYAKTMQKMFVLIGIISGIVLYFVRIPILSLYDLSPETMKMTNEFLIVLSVIVVFMSYQMPTNLGIIRGGGSANFVVIMDLITIWGIVIPLSYVMAFVLKAHPVIVLCCLNGDQLIKGIPGFFKVNYGTWIRKLTRD